MRIRRLLGLSSVALLAACAEKAPQDAFEPKGDKARQIYDLGVPVFIVAGVVGVLVAAASVYLVVRFRRRPGDDDTPDPVQTHGNTKVEIGWTIGPFLLLLPFAFLSVQAIFDLSDDPDDPVVVDVWGHQWWWSFEYDLDGDATNGPEIVTANDLVIPEDRDILLRIGSRDVIHSFSIPSLSGTRDAVPGRTHEWVIEADAPGVYEGQCKEFCGLSHANMRARAVVLTAPQYETWLDQQQVDAEDPDDPVAAAGKTVFEGKCASCHQIDGVNEVEGEADLVTGHAPNLTHFASRGVFASGLFALYREDGSVNRPALEAWLRDPPGELPMSPDDKRGMPNLSLSEQEIDQLVAYLLSLGPAFPAQDG